MIAAAIRAFMVMVLAWLAGLLLIGVLFALPAAAAGSNCARHDQALAGLLRNYGETPMMIGLAAQNRVIEMTANPNTGTWTILVSTPEGQTCLVTSGQSFELIPWPPPGVPS